MQLVFILFFKLMQVWMPLLTDFLSVISAFPSISLGFCKKRFEKFKVMERLKVCYDFSSMMMTPVMNIQQAFCVSSMEGYVIY